MIPIEGLGLVSLSLLLPYFSPFSCMPTHLTFYLTSLSSPTSEHAQHLQRGEERRGEVGTMMKINLNPVLKVPGSQGPGSHTASLVFRKTDPTVQTFLCLKLCLIRSWANGFEKSR